VRSRILLTCLLAVILPAASATADVLVLKKGGRLKGTVQQLTFLEAGKHVEYKGDVLADLWISKVAKDVVKLKDGTKVEGELLSLTFRSVGGALSFKREDVAKLTFGDPLAAARKELAGRRATVDPDDAEALYKLAMWCRSKNLKAESEELAKACLDTDPDKKLAAKAHIILGHTLCDGRWMTRAEARKHRAASREEAAEEAAEPEAGDVEEPTDPAELTKLKAIAAKNRELYEAYRKKAAQMEKEELAKAKSKYAGEWRRLVNRYKVLRKTIREKKKARKKAEEENKGRSSRSINTLTGAVARGKKLVFHDGLEKDEKEFKEVKARVVKLRRLVSAAASDVSKKAAKRQAQVRAVYLKGRRLLRAGKMPSPEDLEKAYEVALKAD
jgi:hypothetical protein